MKLQALLLSFFVLLPLELKATHANFVAPVSQARDIGNVRSMQRCGLETAKVGFLKLEFSKNSMTVHLMGIAPPYQLETADCY